MGRQKSVKYNEKKYVAKERKKERKKEGNDKC